MDKLRDEVIYMFRRVVIRGALGFFGTVVLVWILGGPEGFRLIGYIDYSFQGQLLIPVIFGIIVAICVMFMTWFNNPDNTK